MNPTKKNKAQDPLLRAAAEAQLAKTPQADGPAVTDLMHELQVHQIELEIQNEALREAQQGLEQSRDRYVDLYEFAPLGYLTLSLDGVIQELNLRALTLLGTERKKLLQRFFTQLVIPEDQSHWAEFFLRLKNMDGTGSVELGLQRGEGSVFQALLEGEKRPVGNGTAQIRIALSDISEKKKAETALRESEERYRTAFQTSPDAININRLADGLYLDINQGFTRLTGWTRDEVLGRTSRQINIWRNLGDRQRLVLALQLQGTCENLEADFVTKVGKIVSAQMAASVMSLGGVPCILSITRDMTERKAAQEAQRIAARAFESQQGMFITDEKKVILRVNKVFTEITGYTAEEAVGKTPSLLSSGRQNSAFYAAMWGSISRLGAWQGEIWNRHKNGTVYPEHLSISSVKDDAGLLTHYVGAFNDLSIYKAAEKKIDDLAYTDLLTGLSNRRKLIIRLQEAITAVEDRPHSCALLMLDLDNFKNINDAIGHLQGDQVLQRAAKRLSAAARDGDTVARLDSDEFAVLMDALSPDPQKALWQVETLAQKLLEALNEPYQLDGSVISCTASIGITFFGEQYEDVLEPLKRAELAMYQAKSTGRNTLRFFDPQMQAAVEARVKLETALQQAIQAQQFVLYYQAQISDSEGIVGAEALVRWFDPKRGMVMPSEFIPLAEENGMILPIGRWVLESACQQLVLWASQPAMAHLSIAVNVSARQFRESNFVDQVLAALKRTGANAQLLKMELTESVLIEDAEDVIVKMNALKAIGVGFGIDDFGTGYSSLAYIKRLPLERLKIDQGFVRNILMDLDDAAISRAVIAMASSMGLGVMAEGVETEAQRDFLASLGCHTYQGYLFSRPVPVADFELLVQRFDHASR